jgi:glycosyltransferase involved in cell wall biosynthesis
LSDRESRKLSVVPNCVTVPIFNTVAPGGARSNPVILLIGTRPHKNIWRVVEAVTGMQVILRIVGEMDAALRSELERRSVMYECYVQVDDRAIVQLYRTADVVAFVPTYEGFGLPILEAQAAGVPLVTSARSPMREVAGLGACLVDPESVEEIRFAIAKLISDEAFARQIVEAGFRNVPKYNSASIAAMYKSLYESLLQEST